MPTGKKGRWSCWPNFWTCPLPVCNSRIYSLCGLQITSERGWYY